MRTYKDLHAFERRAIKQDGSESFKLWDYNDAFVLSGKTYRLEEYGTGYDKIDYAEFVSRDGYTVMVRYICPSFSRGVCVKPFRFVSVEKY